MRTAELFELVSMEENNIQSAIDTDLDALREWSSYSLSAVEHKYIRIYWKHEFTDDSVIISMGDIQNKTNMETDPFEIDQDVTKEVIEQANLDVQVSPHDIGVISMLLFSETGFIYEDLDFLLKQYIGELYKIEQKKLYINDIFEKHGLSEYFIFNIKIPNEQTIFGVCDQVIDLAKDYNKYIKFIKSKSEKTNECEVFVSEDIDINFINVVKQLSTIKFDLELNIENEDLKEIAIKEIKTVLGSPWKKWENFELLKLISLEIKFNEQSNGKNKSTLRRAKV